MTFFSASILVPLDNSFLCHAGSLVIFDWPKVNIKFSFNALSLGCSKARCVAYDCNPNNCEPKTGELQVQVTKIKPASYVNDDDDNDNNDDDDSNVKNKSTACDLGDMEYGL